MIYFAQSIKGGAIKIGCTRNVDARIKQLEILYKCPLALLGTREGGREQEAEIHARFKRHRIGRSERFRPDPEILEFIGRPLLAGANSDMTEMMEPARRETMIWSTQAWKDFLKEFAEWARTPSVSDLVDRAIVSYARELGYDKPFPKR